MATKREKREERRKRYADPKKRAEAKASGESKAFKIPNGMKLLKVKEPGVLRLDFLPYVAGEGNRYAEPGELWYERTFYTHYGIGPNKDAVLCLSTINEECPICEFQEKLREDPDHDKKTVGALYRRERQLFLVYNQKTPKDGVMLWEQSYKNFGELLDSRIRESEEDEDEAHFGRFARRKGGSTLKITFVEASGGDFKYIKTSAIDFKLRTEQLPDALYDDLPCLDDLLTPMSYKELNKLFGKTGRDDEDEDHDDRIKGERSSFDDDDDDPPPKKKKKPQLDEDDEEEAPFDDEDDD